MHLEKRLAQISLLNSCTQDELRRICRLSETKRFNENEIIFNEGELAVSFYFIMEGSAHAFTKDKKGKITLLAHFDEDDYFGEQGYLNNSIRTASVKALSDIEVLEIDYDLLDTIFKQSNKAKELLQKSSLGKSIANLQSQLHSIDSYVKKEIFTSPDHARLVGFKKGETIFKKGDFSSVAYFIASGSVALEFTTNGIPAETVVINKNHLFGETGVIGRKPRAASAVALTNVSLIAIPGEDFQAAMSHTVGLKALVCAFENVYALPHHEIITEQFISKFEDSEAIFTKYKLSNQKIVLCATSVDHPIFTMEMSGVKSDRVFHFGANKSKILDISVKDNVVIGLTAVGEWQKLNQLCELVLSEVKFERMSDESFSRYF